MKAINDVLAIIDQVNASEANSLSREIEILEDALNRIANTLIQTRHEWTIEWPTEPGNYWFYGYRFRSRTSPPELNLVKARGVRNGVALIVEGSFMFREEGAYGVWIKANLPDLPSLPREESDESN